MTRAHSWTALTLALVVLAGAAAIAQAPVQAPQTPREMAPIDLTGLWVSVVTEDWRWRMAMPNKGDYSSVPLNDEGRRVADTWDPSRMASDGCRPYGAAGVMRMPGRLRIEWTGERTLTIETDAGQQTRRLSFDAAGRTGGRSWQGQSAAEWERLVNGGGLGVSLATAPPRLGSLKVVTTNLRAGYLRKNGVPYSEDTVVTEYFDRISDEGTDWLTVLTIVEDPRYLTGPFITSTHFRRELDAARWAPAPCD